MEEVFIEQLDQIYWQGYAEQFREDNPDAYWQQLTEFTNSYKIPKNEISNPLFNGTGYSTSDHQNIADTVNEVEAQATFSLNDTPKVKILETEILLTRVRNLKNTDHGTQH